MRLLHVIISSAAKIASVEELGFGQNLGWAMGFGTLLQDPR